MQKGPGIKNDLEIFLGTSGFIKTSLIGLGKRHEILVPGSKRS